MASVLALTTGLNGQELPRALIITGNGNVPVYKQEYPPWIHEFQNEKVADILKDIVNVEITDDVTLLRNDYLREFDLVISNSIFLEPAEDQLDALFKFVSNGKRYMTLHCGKLSLLNWNRYEEFIGGIFIGGPSTVRRVGGFTSMAYANGFYDQSHFIRELKAFTGVVPSGFESLDLPINQHFISER